MSQNVMITGAGKAVGLGFNLVLRYLEAGDTVAATVRKPCAELDELKNKYGDKLMYLNTGNVYSNEYGRYSFNGCTGLFFQIQNDEPTDLVFDADEWEE